MDTRTDIGTDTRRIFIQRVGYEGAIIHILPVSLTSLTLTLMNMNLP